MKKCEKCGKDFKGQKKIDGKVRVFSNRKYCLECSPFGKHNTRNLKLAVKFGPRKCKECGKEYSYKGSVCKVCKVKQRCVVRKQRVISIVGDSCWLCGYNKVYRNMCFHHIDPSEKKMKLSSREKTQNTWKKIIDEIIKCVFVCNRCHGEIHEGLICKDKIENLHRSFWSKINIDDLYKVEPKTDRQVVWNKIVCKSCGGPLSYGTKNGICKTCFRKNRRKVQRPNLALLLSQIEDLGYSGTGRVYGVSDNAIRKWIRQMTPS